MRNLLGALLIGALAWMGASAIRNRGAITASSTSAPVVAVRTQLEIEVLDNARAVAGDPALNERYRTINKDYFGGGLPDVPVSWEPRLDEIAASRGDGLLLEGLTDGKVIVINPRLRADRRLLIATLCHEMVHVRLVAGGAPVGEDHGPAFQQQLRRLLDEGAFEGAYATDEEKAAMKASLATEVAWLDTESGALSAAAADLALERRVVDGIVEDLNARMTKANAEQTAWPSDDEQQKAKDRLAALNERSESHNERVAEFNRRIETYNQNVERYNLAVSYPDGLAATRIAPRQSITGVGVSK